jgi:hypothetical protein
MVGMSQARHKAAALFAAAAVLCAVVLTASSSVSPSFAQRGGGPATFSLGGDTTLVHPGNASGTAAQGTTTGQDGFGFVNIPIGAGVKLRQLNTLATDFKFVVGSCSAGSPRFTVNVTNGTINSSVFFYLGPPPSYTGCAAGSYASSGNLAAPTSLVDASALPGGAFNEPYSQVQADFGDYTITAVHLDVDGRSAGEQTVDFDNTNVNGKLVTYEPEHGISFLIEQTAGSVKVKEPGERGFEDLNNLNNGGNVLVNTVVDTRGGRLEVTAATGNFAQTTPDNSVVFYDGLIRLRQRGARNAPATAKLVGKLRCGKGHGEAKAGKSSGPVATTSRHRGRKHRIWGSGSGNYSTSGSGGTGSVRGTTWLTRDTCRGTFFKVTEGLGISVLDFDLGQKVNLGPGQSYFARNR